MDIRNPQSYRHVAQEIYNIIIKNNEKYTITEFFIFCNFDKVSEISKTEIKKLLENVS